MSAPWDRFRYGGAQRPTNASEVLSGVLEKQTFPGMSERPLRWHKRQGHSIADWRASSQGSCTISSRLMSDNGMVRGEYMGTLFLLGSAAKNGVS
jgi:hypothetical protein